MENEEIPQQSEPQEKEAETTYPVRLRPPVFSFLAEGLRPVYQKALKAVQEDGSYQGINDFHRSSRISRLMNGMLDQFPNPEELPEVPVVDLSAEDIKFLKEAIPAPFDAAGRLTRKELMDELSASFRDARFKARVKNITDGIRSRFGKKS